MSIDIIKIWFRIVICPSVIFFPDIFAMITLTHKQIIAMAGYYACGAFIFLDEGVVGGYVLKNILILFV